VACQDIQSFFLIPYFGVLVAISIPIFTAQLEKSREATDKANIRSAYVEVMTAALTDTGSTHDTTLDVNREGTDGAYVCSSYLALPSYLTPGLHYVKRPSGRTT
jgi:hypothetical protein